jgi:streptogramin lyase
MAAALFHAGINPLRSQTPAPAALAGQVSSMEEGAMEGVLVSAKRAGSTITTTVVTNDRGRYSFPQGRLEPGQYALSIRAVGYEMDDAGAIEVAAGKAPTADLKLRKAKDLSAQLTNAEWMISAPGRDEQKAFMLNCVTCHTVERIMKSKHNEDEFLKVIQRMALYANQSTPLHPQVRKARRVRETKGDVLLQNQQRQAAYLSTINLSSGPALPYDLKTLPRPKGGATQVIITEYDLPRKTIEPHDAILDADGMVWYSNFGEQKVGKLDPKTGKVTEFTIPEQKHGWPTGELGLQSAPDGNLWFGMMYQAGIAKLDRKSGEFQIFPMAGDWNKDMTQINMAAPQSSAVDGKVWMQNNGFAVVHRLDLASGNIETFDPFKDGKEGETHNIYDVIPDSHNNAYFTDFEHEQIGRIDAKTGKITIYTMPTVRAAPRRAEMDSQDRLWIGEYRGNRIAMFDTKTEKFQEWLAPTPWSSPYDVTLDKNGYAWTGSMSTDRVLRLNPQTGQFTEYLLPRSTNIRRVFVDDTTPKPTFWVGNNDGASIIKLETLN